MSLSQVNVGYIVLSSDFTDFYFSIFSISVLFELFVRVLKDSLLQPKHLIKRQKEPLIHHNIFLLSYIVCDTRSRTEKSKMQSYTFLLTYESLEVNYVTFTYNFR